jgi:hypothetical protein
MVPGARDPCLGVAGRRRLPTARRRRALPGSHRPRRVPHRVAPGPRADLDDVASAFSRTTSSGPLTSAWAPDRAANVHWWSNRGALCTSIVAVGRCRGLPPRRSSTVARGSRYQLGPDRHRPARPLQDREHNEYRVLKLPSRRISGRSRRRADWTFRRAAPTTSPRSHQHSTSDWLPTPRIPHVRSIPFAHPGEFRWRRSLRSQRRCRAVAPPSQSRPVRASHARRRRSRPGDLTHR